MDVFIFPTDTIPGLACRIGFQNEIYRLKNRSLSKRLILMTSTIEDCLPYVHEDKKDQFIQKAKEVWPGNTTLIVSTSKKGQEITNGYDTLGFRIPDNAYALSILKEYKELFTTSCNISGQKPLRNIVDIQKEFEGVYIYQEYWTEGSGIPSTILLLNDNKEWIEIPRSHG